MAENKVRQAAKRYRRRIPCTYHVPDKIGQRPILQTHEHLIIGRQSVDPGRWTDGGSIPPIGRPFVNPFGYLFPAFLKHDVDWYSGEFERANEELRENLEHLGAPTWQGIVILIAVRGNAKWQRLKQRRAQRTRASGQ